MNNPNEHVELVNGNEAKLIDVCSHLRPGDLILAQVRPCKSLNNIPGYFGGLGVAHDNRKSLLIYREVVIDDPTHNKGYLDNPIPAIHYTRVMSISRLVERQITVENEDSLRKETAKKNYANRASPQSVQKTMMGLRPKGLEKVTAH